VFKRFSSLLIFNLSILICFPSVSKTLKFIDETYDYSPLNETANDACKNLIESIKLKAIASISGETMSQDVLEICKGTKNEETCMSNTSTFYSLGNAKITNFSIFDGPHPMEESDLLQDHKRCRISATVSITKINSTDPNFDFQIKTSDTDFKAPIKSKSIENTEYPELKLTLSSASNMYFYFFNHLPYQKTFTKIGSEISIKKNSEIEKKFGIAFPPDIEDENTVVEYFTIIGSSKKINFQEKYDTMSFNDKLIELDDNKDFKIREKNIAINIRKK